MGSRRWGEWVLGCLSLLSSSPDLPFRRQWNLLQDGAPPALPRSASAPPPAGEKTKVIMELEATTRGSFMEDSVGYRKQDLTSSPALIRQEEDTTSPFSKLDTFWSPKRHRCHA